MRNNYILIDFENIQPEITAEIPENVFIFLFIGAKQSKISTSLAIAIKELGDRGKFIVCETVGKNALDFLIPFYIGEYFAKDNSGFFHIISKDTGFDPLIEHLKNKKISVQRHADLDSLIILKENISLQNSDIQAIKDKLNKSNGKPVIIDKLKNVIKSTFYNKISDNEVSKAITLLELDNFIKVTNQKVEYLNNSQNIENNQNQNLLLQYIDKIKETLRHKTNRPARIETLSNFISSSILQKDKNQKYTPEIIDILKQKNIITVSNSDKVTYGNLS
jgi:hypothetical protein